LRSKCGTEGRGADGCVQREAACTVCPSIFPCRDFAPVRRLSLGAQVSRTLLFVIALTFFAAACQKQASNSLPPPPPANLAATAGNAQASLTWAASAGATSYNVLRSTTSGSETSHATGVTATSYTDTGLTNGTTYYYVVQAVNNAGASGNSNQASATPEANPDFSISPNPGSATVTQGGNATYTVTIGALGAFTGTVGLSASGMGSGETPAFNPPSVTTSGNSTLTISTSSSAATGTFTITITGTSGSLVHNTTVSLTVNAAGSSAPAFVQGVAQGSSGTSLPNPSTYTINMLNPVAAGNAIVVMGKYASPQLSVSFGTDIPGTSFSTLGSNDDGTEVAFIACGIAAGGDSYVEVKYGGSPSDQENQVWIFYNTSCAVEGKSANNGSVASITAGSIAPSTSGDVFLNVVAQDNNGSALNSWTVGSQSNIVWNGLGLDVQQGLASQWGVYNSTAPLNPVMSMSSSNNAWNSVAVALRAVSQGSALSGMYIDRLLDASVASGASSFTVDMASAGNLLVLEWVGGYQTGSAPAISGISDGTNSYTPIGTGCGTSTAGYANILYSANFSSQATGSGRVLAVSLSNATSAGSTLFVYDVVGAAAAPFDKATNCLTPGDVSAQTFSLPTIAPSGSGEVVFGVAGIDANTCIATTPGVLDSVPDATQVDSLVDQNNCWSHVYSASTSGITIQYTVDSSHQPGGPQDWAGMAAAFKPGP